MGSRTCAAGGARSRSQDHQPSRPGRWFGTSWAQSRLSFRGAAAPPAGSEAGSGTNGL